MTILYPFVFFLFIGIAILGVLQSRRIKSFFAIFNADKKKDNNRSFTHFSVEKIIWKKRAFFWGLIFLIIAGSGIQVGSKVKPIERKGVDLVFMLDVSQSMDAEDIKPSRLQKAKFEISQIIRNLKGDRVSIIVFAGSSHLYLPLTMDYEAAELFLDAIDTKMIPTQGTSLSSAISTGINAFSGEDEKYKIMILISDGEDHEGKAVDIASKASEMGMTINTVGVGTLSGSLVPVSSSNENTREYKKDRQGKLVTSILNEQILIDISKAGNGIYTRFNNRSKGHKELIASIDRVDKKTIATHIFSEYENRYQIPAGLALIILIIEFIIPTRIKKKQKDT